MESKTPISTLYELCTRRKLAPPSFRLVSDDGDEAERYVYVCEAGGLSIEGKGRNKQDAKHNAAEAVLAMLHEDAMETKPRRGSTGGSSRLETDFEDIQYLGHGSFGKVFKARHKLDNNEYAVKCVFWPSVSANDAEKECERVRSEVKTLAKLDNSHLIKYITVWFEDMAIAERRQFYDDLLLPEVRGLAIGTQFGSESDSQSSHASKANGGGFVQSKPPADQRDDTEQAHVAATAELPSEKHRGVNSTGKFMHIQLQLCRESLYVWLWRDNTRIFDLHRYNPTGPSVFDLRNRQEHVLSVTEQIAKALRYLHDKRLMHRDLKPGNVLFALDGRIVVSDLGSVKQLVKPDMFSRSTGANEAECASECNGGQACGQLLHSMHTAGVGTHTYRAPEMLGEDEAESVQYDEKVDLYALGVIFLELLHPFFTCHERIQKIKAAKSGYFPREFRVEDYQLLKRLLSPSPKDRPSAERLLKCDPILQYRRIKAEKKLTPTPSTSQNADANFLTVS